VRHALAAAAIAVLLLAAAPLGAVGAATAGTLPAGLVNDVAVRYRQAVRTHDAALAARLRTETRLIARVDPAYRKLADTVAQTRNEFRPWPLADDVDALAPGAAVSAPARPYDAVRHDLDAAHRGSILAGLDADALSRGLNSPALDTAIASMLTALDRGTAPDTNAVRDALNAAEQSNGDVKVSHATVVTDAAILVFREGLEAVLILAAITASFVGARKHLRRPVLLGGLAGIGATALTWAIVQLLIEQLGTGGLRLEAITGIVAIAVLLVITNWFFHRVYWSQWIARFNRRRRSLEKVGFLSGQAVGLAILGLTSVYREGFETVLFIQNLQVSAGTQATVLGSGIGLAATLAVGIVTFALQRKLPYKKMLIATGVMIAFVLAVMVGNTAHVLQGLGWLPSTPTGFTLPVWANSWFGLFATYEGLALQFAALLAVIGSYVVAREVQVKAPQRRRARAATAA
jgi:FTR1 family protein